MEASVPDPPSRRCSWSLPETAGSDQQGISRAELGKEDSNSSTLPSSAHIDWTSQHIAASCAHAVTVSIQALKSWLSGKPVLFSPSSAGFRHLLSELARPCFFWFSVWGLCFSNVPLHSTGQSSGSQHNNDYMFHRSWKLGTGSNERWNDTRLHQAQVDGSKISLRLGLPL